MFKKLAGVVCFVSVLTTIPVRADNDTASVTKLLSDVGRNAAYGFTQPLVTVLGQGMNSGWYNSAKPLSLFGMAPFGIAIGMVNVPFVVIDSSMKSFNFEGNLPVKSLLDNYFSSTGLSVNLINSTIQGLSPVLKDTLFAHTGINFDSIGIESTVHFKAPNQPTIFGSDTAKSVALDSMFEPNGIQSKTIKTLRAYNALKIYQDSLTTIAQGHSYTHALSGNDTINLNADITLPFRGLGNIINELDGLMFSIPSVQIEAGISKIPIIGNLTVGLRMVPETDLKSISSDIPFGKVGVFGYKVQYEFLHLIPGASLLPIKSSVMFAQNKMWLHSDTVNLDQSSWIAQLIASADAHFGIFGAGIYAGIGYEGSDLNLDVKMSKVDASLPDFTLDIPGKNTFRVTVGPRISIGFLEVYGDANFGSVTSYNIGVTILGFTGRGF